ncbi:hypothetical protein [Ruegeria halocynthiae]|uniref:hypothetical protein n=1 Tax=Ruegeria halocynthiae TaxID=985054 RepID=UPI0005627B11|nr:hypothetical protein [Ruegeria halocynthiae]
MTKITVGACIGVAGWIFLIGFTGADTDFGQVVNLHLVSIAENVILLGYALVLWGAIEQVGDKVTARINVGADSTPTKTKPTERTSETTIYADEELAERKRQLEMALANRKP